MFATENAAVLVTCVSVNDNVTYDFELVFKIVFYFSIRYRRERIIALMKKQDRFDACYKGCAKVLLLFLLLIWLAAAVIISGMRLMYWSDCFVGRRNRFYSIGVSS